MIRLEGLCKSFTVKGTKKQVLKNISFECRDSEVFGLLGPNGAGKTTTLRTIATLIRPDSGRVEVDDYDVVKHGRQVRNRIGFLTGDMKLTGHLSCRDMLEYFGELNHLDKETVSRRIAELAKQMEMEDYLDKQIAKLSAGMAQKTSIAVSILHDPHVIVFDEPTSNLDVMAVKVVSDFLHEVKQAGKCIVLSTHILSEAERLCDRVGIMHQGELLCSGVPAQLYEKYQVSNLEDLFFSLVNHKEVSA